MRFTGVVVLCALAGCAVSCRGGGDKEPEEKEKVGARRRDPWYELALEVSTQNERVLAQRLSAAGRHDLLPRLRQDFHLFNEDPERMYAFARRARRDLKVEVGGPQPTRTQLDDYIRAQAANAGALDLAGLERALRGQEQPQDRLPCPPYCK